MKDLKDRTADTSPYEILVHLTERILSGDLATFDALKTYVSVLPEGPRTELILKKAFELQRRLTWGFFRDVTPETFPRVWDVVVLTDDQYPFAGDLRRYISMPDVFVGILDIRGYTKYCRDNRRNLSMLDLLDRMMQEDIPRVAAKDGVVSRRSQGDALLLAGASAPEVLRATLEIIEYFSRRRRSSDDELPAGRPGSGLILPEFRVSAGIAGGQKYTPLVITRDGDLSGDILNTAARLQARAGKVSPDRSRVLLTSHAFQRVRAAACGSDRGILGTVDFFNAGTIDFKGASIGVVDTVFLATEAYRLSYRDLMEELYDSVDKGMWKSKVFLDTLGVAARMAENLPGIIPRSRPGADSPETCREGILERIKNARSLFESERFELAVAALGALAEDFSRLSAVDESTMEYIRAIHANYEAITATFVSALDREIDERMDQVLTPKEIEDFLTQRSHSRAYEKSLTAARLRIRNRKSMWYRSADATAPGLEIRIQSLK